MATKEQLRKLRQKYHLGEFRNKTRSVPMARRTRRTASRVRTSVRRFRRSHVQATNLKTLALMGVGAGIGSGVSVFVRHSVPQVNSLPSVLGLDVVELGVGYLAYKYGNKLPMGKFVKPIGAGMMIDSIGGAVGTVTGSFLGGRAGTTTALY